MITLTGSTTLANYQTAIAAITFNNTETIPDRRDRTIDVTVNDGDIDSNIATTTIQWDTDGDGVADTNDIDDDNDGILDTNEQVISSNVTTPVFGVPENEGTSTQTIDLSSSGVSNSVILFKSRILLRTGI